jgi:hypothetical protein
MVASSNLTLRSVTRAEAAPIHDTVTVWLFKIKMSLLKFGDPKQDWQEGRHRGAEAGTETLVRVIRCSAGIDQFSIRPPADSEFFTYLAFKKADAVIGEERR